MIKKNDMSILLEVQKYNHYRILQEAYVPKEVKFAITEDKKYVIVDSELFDIEKNESLGLYYESRLLKEEIITESWFETIADIAVGVGSAALAATGVGVAAAQAIDVLHGLSFIYRGNTRNDKVLTVMGYFSLALALFPALGTAMKNVLVAVAKKFVGKPIASLIKAIAKNKVGLNIVKKLQGMITKLSGKVTQFNTWAKEYKWFDKVWSKIGSSFAGGLKYFDDFLGKVVKESSKAGSKALPAAGAKAAQKAAGKGAQSAIGLTKMSDEFFDVAGKAGYGLNAKAALAFEKELIAKYGVKNVQVIEQELLKTLRKTASKRTDDMAIVFGPKQLMKLVDDPKLLNKIKIPKVSGVGGNFVNSVDDVVMKTLKTNKGVSTLPKGAAFIDDAGMIARYGDDVLVKAESGKWYLANVNNGNVIAKNMASKGFIKQGRKITGKTPQEFLTKKALERFNSLGAVKTAGSSIAKTASKEADKLVAILTSKKVTNFSETITKYLATKNINKQMFINLIKNPKQVLKKIKIPKIPKNVTEIKVFRPKIKSIDGEPIFAAAKAGGKGVVEVIKVPIKAIKSKPQAFNIIPKNYRVAAAGLAGLGAGYLLFSDSGDDDNYIVYNKELENELTKNGVDIVPAPFEGFEQGDVNKSKNSAFSDFTSGDVKAKGGGVKGKSKTATSKSTKPTVVTDYDGAWDYKKEGGNYFTKRKGKKNWIKVTPEMKGGKPYQSIKTNVFKD